MKKNCNLIQDLLPLYIENMTSPESTSVIKEHLKHCSSCSLLYLKMSKNTLAQDEDDGAAIKKIKKAIIKNRKNYALLAASLVSVFLIFLFSFITRPDFIPFSKDLCSFMETSHNEEIIVFNDIVTNYQITQYTDIDGYQCMEIIAWTSNWDLQFGKKALYCPIPDDVDVVLYNSGSNHQRASVLWSRTSTTFEAISLGSLSLSYLAILSALFFLISLIIYLIAKKHFKNNRIFLRVMAVPLSFLLGYFCTCGLSTASFLVVRDNIFVFLLSSAWYGVLFTTTNIITAKFYM